MKLRAFFKLFVESLKARFLRPTSRQKPLVYVALGDSTTEGVGASHPSKSFPYLIFKSLKKELKYVEYHNFGKKFSQIDDVVSSQLLKAIELKPDLITISVGANDMLRKIGVKKFRTQFKFLLHQLSRETSAIIVVNNIPDFALSTLPVTILLKSLANLKAKSINSILEEETKAADALFVDINSQSKFLRKHKSLVSSDRLHPSDLGHAIWGSAIISAVKPIISEKYKMN